MTRLYINDVSPRDGFQNENTFIPTADKIALIDALSATGLAKIEVTSFVSPKAIPALADAESVMKGIARRQGVVYTVLVPNLRGAERALACRVDEFNVVMSASEAHNRSNLRMTRGQSLDALGHVMTLARAAGVPVNASLSVAFGCPMQGEVSPTEVLQWAGELIDRGARGVTLCDTTGMAYPTQVQAMTDAFRCRHPGAELTLHFHDTRSMALANVMAGLGAGATRFDASLGGLGGCPYAPGASGNACLEDMVQMLELCGHDTGIDLDALLACARRLPALVGHDVPGQTIKAGRRLDLHPLPAGFEETAGPASGLRPS
jgi:hydroxymethylglutaryl-CoA lyase